MDTTKSKAVLDGFAKIVKVPQSRFYTAIDLKDGTTKSEGVDETAGGFAKATTAKDINFMIIQKSAVIQYPKHTVNKVVTPEENQTDDSWLFFFRAYGLADVYEKQGGRYLSAPQGIGGVVMAKTVGLTFNEKPITIEPPADYCENENVIDYKSMTVPELKAYAAELGIDLGSASKKDAIIQEIVDAVAVEDTTSETEV